MIERWGAVLLLTATLGGCGDSKPKTSPSETVKLPEPTTANSSAVSGSVVRSPARSPSREPIAYTSLKPAKCKLLDEKVEEGGYSRHRCGGIAGYALETSESDLRQSLTVIAPDGKRTALDLSAGVAKGAFNALGSVAEWRGKDRKAANRLIVRLNVANPKADAPDTSNLIVLELGDPTCIVAVVPPGRSQNEVARDVADGPPKDCLKD